LQKRLAASVLGCGKKRVWLDPTESSEISLANSRQSIRRLVKDGFIIRKPVRMHSRWRVRKVHEAKAKGRHMGQGTRKGTREARTPSKLLWIRRIRVLRRLLKKYRTQNKIDKHVYHMLYMKAKGNVYRNKRVLMEAIEKAKIDVMAAGRSKARAKIVAEQAAAIRAKKPEKPEKVEKKAKKTEKPTEKEAEEEIEPKEETEPKEEETKPAEPKKEETKPAEPKKEETKPAEPKKKKKEETKPAKDAKPKKK